jgi:hypothetical protein
MLTVCSDTTHFAMLPSSHPAAGQSGSPGSLNKEADVVMRVQLMRIDVRQHDLIIANRDDSVALLLPDVEISLILLPDVEMSLIELPGMVEFQFVHSRSEVRNRRTTFANDKRIGTITTSHGHVAARRHQRVI